MADHYGLPATDFNALLLKKPMKFGTERDFHTALAELKWLRQQQGLLSEDDFKQVATKYVLPKDMLAEELNGQLKFPNDYMISESRWFPVLYSWALDQERARNDLFLKVVHHQHSRWNYQLALVLLPTIVAMVMLSVWTATQTYFGYDLSDAFRIEQYLLPAIPLVIALLLTLRFGASDNWKPVREQIIRMKREGLGSTVDSLIDFVTSKEGARALGSRFHLRQSDDEILRWYEQMPTFTFSK